MITKSQIEKIFFDGYEIVREPTPELDREIHKLEKTVEGLIEGDNPLKHLLLQRIYPQISLLKDLRKKIQFYSDDIEAELAQLNTILSEYRDLIESHKLSGFDASNFEILALNVESKMLALARNRRRKLSRVLKGEHEFETGTSECVFQWRGMSVGLELCIDAGILHQKGYRNLDIGALISCNGRNLHRTMDALENGGSGVLIDGTYTDATGAVTKIKGKSYYFVGQEYKTRTIRPNQIHPWLPIELGGTIDPKYHEKPEKPYRTVSISMGY